MSVRTRIRALLLMVGMGILVASPVRADFKSLRQLSEVEQRGLMSALLADPQMPMSEDPSCKSDLSKPGRVSVAQAVSSALARAAAEGPSRVVRVDCFRRPGYPIAAGQEYCRLAFVDPRKSRDGGFGLLFVMDWKHKTVATDSAECY